MQTVQTLNYAINITFNMDVTVITQANSMTVWFYGGFFYCNLAYKIDRKT